MVDVLPVVPGGLVVLAVGVVVALLGPADLVTAEEHGHALGEEQGGEEIALLAATARPHIGIVRRPLHPAVPGPVVALTVPVVLAVRLVVLLVVRDEVRQGE